MASLGWLKLTDNLIPHLQSLNIPQAILDSLGSPNKVCELLQDTETGNFIVLLQYSVTIDSRYSKYGISKGICIKQLLFLQNSEFINHSVLSQKLITKLKRISFEKGAESAYVIWPHPSETTKVLTNFYGFQLIKKWKNEDLLKLDFSRPSFKPPNPTTRITLHAKYIQFIKDGSKTVEGRCRTPMFTNIRVGSIIEFFCKTNSVTCEVTRVNKYLSFRELLKSESVEACLPDIKRLEDAVNVYDRIPGYREKAKRFGVIGFHVRLIN